MEPLKLGLIGLGGMGQSHLEKEKSLGNVHFVGVADVIPSVVDEVSRTYDVPGFYGYQQLIDSGNCEAVLIAAPHPFHCPIALYAIEHGLHVLSEKPIAVTVSEADQMIDAANRAGVKLGVMFQTRTDPLMKRAHDLLTSGVIGDLYRSVMVASHWYRTQAYYDSGAWRGTWKGEGGGVIMNQSPHSLDLFIWLGGRPRQVQARVETRFHRIEVEDAMEALIQYEPGHTGSFYTTTAEWPGENRMEFTGTRGKLVIQDGTLRLYRMEKTIQQELSSGVKWGKATGQWETTEVPAAPHGHANVVDQFARAIRQGEPLIATGDDGRNALELANALLLSGYRQKPVNLPIDRTEYDQFLSEKRAGG
ncbi:MAG TPA: Gfo/Idh/MocA family oxidoreductase [Chloroflexota bacterium]|nr:Gfo/Idh/MocA family oxidoreductase [Chloroflexota bacterium]